jgi:hypothetical protein
MLQTVRYIARPQTSDRRRHQIPIDVVRKLTGGDRCALDGRMCLFEILVRRESNILTLPAFVAHPSSGDELVVSLSACPGYPHDLAMDEELIVGITLLPSTPSLS